MVRGHQAPAHPLPQHPAKLPEYHQCPRSALFPAPAAARAVRRADLQRCLDACAGMSSIIGSLTRSVLVHAVRYALTENLLDVDISAALMLPPVLHRPGQTAFTPEEEERLLRTAASSPDGLMIYLLYYLGCRRGKCWACNGAISTGTPAWCTSSALWISIPAKQRLHPGAPPKPPPATAGTRPRRPDGDPAPLRGLPQTLLISDQGAPSPPINSCTRWAHLMHAAGFLHLSPRYEARRAAALEAGKPCKAPNISYDYDADITPTPSAITTSPAASPPASPPRSPCAS